MNSELQSDSEQTRAWLSALVDGEGDGAEHACARWRDDAGLRRDWHAYQLIGDVMRSEDLAVPAARDAAFLAGLRARLADEPVVLAPQPAAVSARRRQPWLMPVAAAAGFVVVAGVLVVARMNPAAPAGDVVARETVAPRAGAVAPDVQPVMLYDPAVEQYVRAHRSVGGTLVMAPVGGGLRRVELSAPAVPAR